MSDQHFRGATGGRPMQPTTPTKQELRDRIDALEDALRESVKAMEYAKGYLDVPGSFNPMNNHPATVLYNAIGPARALIGEA